MSMEYHPWVLTRRRALLLVGSGFAAWGRLDAASGDFWEKKAPSEWDAEQIERLLHKSPWAKDVTAQRVAGDRDGSQNGGGYPGGGGGYPGGGGMGGPRVGMGIPGIGGIGMPRRGGGGGRRGGQGQGGSYEKGTVRWESAKPILEAQKLTALPDAFANHYVISVSGIPLRDGRQRTAQTDDDNRDSSRQSPPAQDDSLDNLKQFTTLQPKGKDLIQAGVVERSSNAYSSFLFGFSKEMLELTKSDKEVSFETRLGQLMVKAKFEPKEMLYHKVLAV